MMTFSQLLFARPPANAPVVPNGTRESPASSGPGLEPASVGESPAESLGPVLIVDDDAEMLAQAERILRGLELPILLANNGPRALVLALQEKPSLIVLDAMLPGLRGFEVCRELKATPETKEIPIVLSSALYSDWRAHEDARRSCGAEALLAKPFQPDVLTNVARDLLFGRSSFDALPGLGMADARRGRRALERGDAAEAVMRFTSATRAQPCWAEAYFYLGLALDAAGQPYQAVSALERAIELKPDYFLCLERLATLYERCGFERAARGTWERAMACCPTREEQDDIGRRLARLLAPNRSRGTGS